MQRKRLSIDIPWPDRSPAISAIRSWLPSRGNVAFGVLLVMLLLWAQTAGALPLPGYLNAPDAPSTGTIAYQGRLADAVGNPLTSTVNMEFRLYNAAAGGTPLWSELWTGPNAVQVSDGLFNVMLGSLDPIPQSIMTGNSSLWLGITAGTDDEMMPRVQLGSVPFAVQALTVPDGSISRDKVGFAVAGLLGHKTVDQTHEPTEILPGVGWHPVKGVDANDIIEVTVATNGGPVLASMTTRYELTPPGTHWCGIYVYQNGTQVRRALLDGVEPATEAVGFGCSGSYLFTDLLPGSYTFRAMAYTSQSATVRWFRQRQIVVIEY